MTAIAMALAFAALGLGLPVAATAQNVPPPGIAAPDAPDQATPDQATPAPGDDGGIVLDLNGAVETDAGNCRLTMVTTNRLDRGLSRAAWQVAIFDAQGVVQALPILDFGALAQGKTKVALFELPGTRCDAIGRIIVNDVAECRAEDDGDLRDACLTGLATQTRTPIDFGL